MLDNDGDKSFLDSNTILAVILSFGVFVVWQIYMSKKYPPQDPQQTQVAQTQTDEQTAATTNKAVENSGQKSFAPATGQDPSTIAPEKEEKLVRFEGENLIFEVSNRGMGLKSIILKNFSDREGEPIHFSWTLDQLNVGETKVTNKDIHSLLDERNFATFYDGKPIYFDVKQENETTFVGRANFVDGSIIKTIILDDKTYSAKVEVETTWTSVDRGTMQTLIYDRIKNEEASWFRPTYEGTDFVNLAEGSEERSRLKIDEPFNESFKNVTLSAIASQYFALMVKDQSEIIPSSKHLLISEGEVGFAKTLLTYRPGSQSKDSKEFLIFMGPKKYDILSQIHPTMASVINFGFFGFIAKPMLQLLKYLYSLIGNWGVAIIFLTLIVRLLLFPIAMSSMRSMKKMQKIQPELKLLREKFKDDPQKMNQETMLLMKREGANPLGGCLPLFAQIPVFFALYSVLGVSVELYKAPFVLWIKDLSFQDPYFVMPIMVSLLFFLQMKLSPTQMDPTQQRVMMIMPLVFGVLMFSLPAGLMVYFITNTVFGIGQQFYINREKATS